MDMPTSELLELRDITNQAGFGTLAYTLECARLECVWLIEQQEEAERPRWLQRPSFSLQSEQRTNCFAGEIATDRWIRN